MPKYQHPNSCSQFQHLISCYLDFISFLWILDTYYQLLLSVDLWAIIVRIASAEEVHKGVLSIPTKYTALPSSDKDQPLIKLVVVHFACSKIAYISHFIFTFITLYDLFETHLFQIWFSIAFLFCFLFNLLMLLMGFIGL